MPKKKYLYDNVINLKSEYNDTTNKSTIINQNIQETNTLLKDERIPLKNKKNKIINQNNQNLQETNTLLKDERIPLKNKKNKIINQNNQNLLDTNIVSNDVKNNEYCDFLITWNDFKKKEKMYYEVINDFFIKKCSCEDILLIDDIINGSNIISLRFLDWFVTRYCDLYKLSIDVNNNYNKEKNININISYKSQLKSFKKKYFDPFKRKKKFVYSFDKQEISIVTNIGQLNFFKWALSFDIIKYVQINFKSINNKVYHVNSYFKKNIIESNSYTLTTTEETTSDLESSNNIQHNLNEKSSIENISYDSCSTNLITNNKILKLKQNDIDLLMNTNKSTKNIDDKLNLLKNKPKKIHSIKKLNKNNAYNPIVSRNICIEL